MGRGSQRKLEEVSRKVSFSNRINSRVLYRVLRWVQTSTFITLGMCQRCAKYFLGRRDFFLGEKLGKKDFV